MKSGPIIAMIALVCLGMWLVLQPALSHRASDLKLSVGSMEIELIRTESNGQPFYEIVEPVNLRTATPLSPVELDAFVNQQKINWNSRPAFERYTLGFFNITTWGTFSWIIIGLIGQGAFFGRMFVQWIISEKTKVSTVPEIFWWFSLIGGICLFTYFVWRVDIVGVMGQSTGIVIYARNLRLIFKEKKRAASDQPVAEPTKS